MNTVANLAIARSTFLPVAVAFCAVTAHAEVILVAPLGGKHTQIQAAVTAANPGDVILVRTGTYSAVTVDAKPLTIAADIGATPTVNGTIAIRNIAAGNVVVLSGLIGRGQSSSSESDSAGLALSLDANAGFVRVESCNLSGATGWGDGTVGTVIGECCSLPLHDRGWDAVRVETSSRVSFTACTITGGRGANAYIECYCGAGDFGGVGLRVASSSVSVHDSTVRGGAGGGNGGEGGDGAAALRILAAGGVIASNTTFGGGNGGAGYDFISSEGGDGGAGLIVDTGAVIQHIDCSFAGGAGGLACGGLFPPGAPGVPQIVNGLQFEFLAPSASFASARVAREGTTLALTVRGEPGALAALRIARQPAFQPIPSQRGVVLTQSPQPDRFRFLGTIPGSGVLQTSLVVPRVDIGSEASTYFFQISTHHATNGITLGNGTSLIVLAAAL